MGWASHRRATTASASPTSGVSTEKFDNCYDTINCTITSPDPRHDVDHSTWALGLRLCLMNKWAGSDDMAYDDQLDPERHARSREEVANPEAGAYQPKYVIAVDLIEAAMEACIDYACVIADINYDMHSIFRKHFR